MRNYTNEFFSKAYNMGPGEYGELVERNEPGQFFRELYGHTIGYDQGAVPEFHRSSYHKDYAKNCIENKLVRTVDNKTGVLVYRDTVNDYFFNSDGFRSDYDFDGTEEVIFTGCSHTVGEGVPEHTVWGAQVAKSLGMRYANISRSGGSVSWCVDAVFGYLKKYKAKPKYILALMPDFHRIVGVPNHLIATPYEADSKQKIETKNSVVVGNQWIWNSMFEVPKYLKQPYPMSLTMTRETAMMQNLRAIHALEAYCEAAGITILWGTWAPDEEELFANTKIDFPDLLENFIDVEARNWHNTGEQGYYSIYHKAPGNFGTDWSLYGNCKNEKECSGVSCHSDLEDAYGENFHLGTDWPESRKSAHFGVHRHTHYAERFIKEIAKLKK